MNEGHFIWPWNAADIWTLCNWNSTVGLYNIHQQLHLYNHSRWCSTGGGGTFAFLAPQLWTLPLHVGWAPPHCLYLYPTLLPIGWPFCFFCVLSFCLLSCWFSMLLCGFRCFWLNSTYYASWIKVEFGLETLCQIAISVFVEIEETTYGIIKWNLFSSLYAKLRKSPAYFGEIYSITGKYLHKTQSMRMRFNCSLWRVPIALNEWSLSSV